MGWGTSWDKVEQTEKETVIYSGPNMFPEINHVELRVPNKFPTHDPYTNPGAYLYYECECGEVLDPRVKSFASLNNHASNEGWKVRWGERSYVPYCPKCAKEKEIE